MYLDAPDFGGGVGLTVHIRTTRRYEYSSITTVAVRVGESVMEVSGYGLYSLNGVIHAEMPGSLEGYKVTHEQVNKKRHNYVVDLMDGGEAIQITSFRDIVSVSIVSASKMQNSKGLLGQFGTGTMLARDGKTVIADPVAFGNEWQGWFCSVPW